MDKCLICDGTGTSNTCVNGTFKPCSFCDGTGEYEPFDTDVELDKLDSKPQTNEEWFCSLSTEEKAKYIAKAMYFYSEEFGLTMLEALNKSIEWEQGLNRTIENNVVDWLKAVHKE